MVIAAFKGAIMTIGGVGSARDPMIIAVLPFSGLVAVMEKTITAMTTRTSRGSVPAAQTS